MGRRKNTKIKKAGTVTEYTPYQIQEMRKCERDPVYFIKKYVKIQHPTRGAIKFKLYDYQIEMIRAYQENRFNIILSARQTGKSTTSAIYLLWYAMFNFDKKILIASNKNKGAMEMIHRIRYAYENLPFWLKPGVTDDGWNKHTIGFDNDSIIDSTATSEDSGRGEALSLLFLDEFAFVKPNIQEEFWTSILPTLSTGGSCIMSSTPNGDSDKFAELWRIAMVGKGVETDDKPIIFLPMHIKWDAPPGRDEKFKQQQISMLGDHKWKQEYECEFISSEALLFSSIILKSVTPTIDNSDPLFEYREVKFWSNIVTGGTYLIGVDPATGVGSDFSVITVFEFPKMEQVAEFRSNSMSSAFTYQVLKNIIKHLEKFSATVYFSVENNGVGEGIIALYEADEHPPELAEFVHESGNKKRGMTTTKKTKMRMCLSFKDMFEKFTLKIKSKILLQEMKTFTRKGQTYSAQYGSSDDCISAVLVIMRLLEEISAYEQVAFDKLYALEDDEWTLGTTSGDTDEDDDDLMPFIM